MADAAVRPFLLSTCFFYVTTLSFQASSADCFEGLRAVYNTATDTCQSFNLANGQAFFF